SAAQEAGAGSAAPQTAEDRPRRWLLVHRHGDGARIMRGLPRSMSGQLLVLLLLAVVAAHLIAVLMQMRQLSADTQVHPLSVREIESRIAAVYRVAVEHSLESDAMLAALSLPESRFQLSGSGLVKGGNAIAQEAAL